MATWKSESIDGDVEDAEDGHLTYKTKKFRWEYQTTADVLTIFEGDEVLCSFDYERTRLLCKLIEDFVKRYNP